ncbi:hypothetical protein [Kitasatospora camelliae]|uniref:Uncharacterized protein n=1 Tax=Kitasatospora camelliae TaxID=3156397 RepID=A0AAU8K647_9ACTN
MVGVLLLIIAAIVLGLIGVVADGLAYLLAIGVVVFLVALALGVVGLRRGGRRPVRRPVR